MTILVDQLLYLWFVNLKFNIKNKNDINKIHIRNSRNNWRKSWR
jgi:hypothetical protein